MSIAGGRPAHSTVDAAPPRETLAALRAGTLAGARALRLPGLGLETVPDAIRELADTLELLDLSDNGIADLPAWFADLRRLRVVFLSGNPMARLPPVLGACPALSQVGARGCGLREVPADALPPRLRWLTLTDNALEQLPNAIGERPALQKLMLAGNRLGTLPESLREAASLELLRLSSNRFEALPPWLAAMPRLAWLAWSGNPLDAAPEMSVSRAIAWADLSLGALLGEGASGRVHAAALRRSDDAPQAVAVKLFKGAMTSDGLPAREMAACLAAGTHPNLAGGLGFVAGHPEASSGLVMPLLPSGWRVLAGPPSLESCSRDVYEADRALAPDAALRIAAGVARGCAHLHARGLLHGDLYAHNVLWDGLGGAAVLSDFGAASFMPKASAAALARLDVLAFGILLGELLEHGGVADASVGRLVEACAATDPAARPAMAAVAAALPLAPG